MRNFELEEDIVETMTANILKLIEKPIFQMLEQVDNLDGITIRVNVKVQIDNSDINRWLNKDSQEISTLVEQMKALRKANEEQARQIEELKRQLANNPQDKEQISKQFADEDKIFLSNQKVDEAWKLCNEKKDYNGAIKILDEAIKLNPNNALAYNNRGNAYQGLKQYELAIQDYYKAIELNPNDADYYYNRGIAYNDLKQYEQAIQDFDKAIKLNPNFSYAYNNRGFAYYFLNKYQQALKDFDKAIELNPNHTPAKNNRETCLKAMGK